MATSQPEEQRLIKGIIAGCGNRGLCYTRYALIFPERLQIVGAADPREARRTLAQSAFGLSDDQLYNDWREMAEKDKFADFVLVATQDRFHKEPAIAFARKGYHILLEKPMAVTEEDCKAIADACNESGVMLCVCHVLRYAPANRMLKELADSGEYGRLVNIQHLEPVGYFHFAHSYVRGNWRRLDESSPALLAKSCHDVDLIRWWMGGSCKAVSSFGSLSEFHPDKKPAEATKRCIDCPLQDTCAYSAVRIYQKQGWFAGHITEGPATPASIKTSLETTNYGKCVWQSDNDVVDNQVVNFQFDDGRTASFSMIAFTEKLCQRETTFFLTEGQLRCFGDEIEAFSFKTGRKKIIPCPTVHPAGLGGHGGSDYHLMHAFVQAVAKDDPSFIVTSADDAFASHKLVFQAEKSRVEHCVVDIEDM
eukprot:m.361744 g.361744  ORF g.361744 m.361744 type:complete len:422 (+) comp19852_c0_seq1:203-1468(+)